MKSVAFRPGQRFKFPGDDQVYTFKSICYDIHGTPSIVYEDNSEKEFKATGYELGDLIHV